jgi:hypothetical protein
MEKKKVWNKPVIKAEMNIRETLGPDAGAGDGKSKNMPKAAS